MKGDIKAYERQMEKLAEQRRPQNFGERLRSMKRELKEELRRMPDQYSLSGMIVRDKILQMDAIIELYEEYREGGKLE